jgi:hypothetical protein
MRNTLLAGAAALVLSAAAAEAAAIVGSINFAGSNTYNTTTNMVDFINPQTVTSDTIGFAPCIGCGVIAGPTGGVFDYSSAFPAPPAKPLVYYDLLDAVANGKVFSFDLQTITQIIEEPNVSVAIQGTGLLHLTGFDDTPGSFFFSTQGPENLEVSFSATNTAIPIPEPGTWALFGAGVLAVVVWHSRRRVTAAL